MHYWHWLQIVPFSVFIVRQELTCVIELGEIRGIVANEIEEKFRRTAMRKYGYGKGSLSKAIATALKQWIDNTDSADSCGGNR